MESFWRLYSIPASATLQLPGKEEGIIVQLGAVEVCMNEKMFKVGLELPFPNSIRAILLRLDLVPQWMVVVKAIVTGPTPLIL